ncbi:hypothetical protein BH11PLA2_BH11PLA2_22790 [soil metagenome]
MDNPTPVTVKPLSPLAKNILGYALAFALAYIAAKWGIMPGPTPAPPVIVMPQSAPALVQP